MYNVPQFLSDLKTNLEIFHGLLKNTAISNFVNIRPGVSARKEKRTDWRDEVNGLFSLLKAPNNSINREQEHCMAYYLSVPI